jgi:tRNA pseudouridine38-40 synthase
LIDMQALQAKNTKSGRLYRIALGLEYDGSNYNGWQMQPHAPSIQEALANAISIVANEPVKVFGAGRTDTGVHATMQVAHFDTVALRDQDSWRRGINSNLPEDINIHWVRPVTAEFNARFSAVSRAYRYLLLNRITGTAIDRKRVWCISSVLNFEAMREAAAYLVGTHDFDAFRASSCQSKSAVRTILNLKLTQNGDSIALDVRGNAFLHHMIRNIMGSLVRVGSGDAEPDWIRFILESRDRTLSGITAPPQGLYFVDVVYPDSFALPANGTPVSPIVEQSPF